VETVHSLLYSLFSCYFANEILQFLVASSIFIIPREMKDIISVRKVLGFGRNDRFTRDGHQTATLQIFVIIANIKIYFKNHC